MLCIFHIQKSFGRQKTKKSFSLVIIFPYFVFLLWNWLWDIHYTYCMSIVCTIRRMSSIFILLYGVLYRASPHFPISFRWQANKAGKSIAGLTMRIRKDAFMKYLLNYINGPSNPLPYSTQIFDKIARPKTTQSILLFGFGSYTLHPYQKKGL